VLVDCGYFLLLLLLPRQGGDSVMADAAAAVSGAAVQLPPGSYPLTATANSFLAGVLDHLPALLPFTAPAVNSYERLKPCCWSGEGTGTNFGSRSSQQQRQQLHCRDRLLAAAPFYVVKHVHCVLCSATTPHRQFTSSPVRISPGEHRSGQGCCFGSVLSSSPKLTRGLHILYGLIWFDA
jgi:hypothetical protein